MPDRAKIPHMELVMGKRHQTEPDKLTKLAVEIALIHNAYDEIGLKALNIAVEKYTMMVTTMPDTGASMYLIGR